MVEGLDPNLRDKWNRKLRKVGLPARLKSLRDDISVGEVLSMGGFGTEVSLEKFKTLSDGVQSNILDDLKEQRKNGMPANEILSRFDVLVDKSQEFEQATLADSGRNRPGLFREKSETEELKDEISRRVDSLIRKIEKIRRRDNFVPKGVDKYKH